MKALTVRLLALACGAALVSAPAFAATPTQYVAHLHALNTNVTHSDATGVAHFTINGNKLTIDIRMQGTPANTVHWQHFHGFKDGAQATCATASEDANHDGIVDLMETSKTSGTTMVPFITHPASMNVAKGTYPKSNAKGSYHYHETVSLSALDKAFAKAFPGQKLDLSKRVVYIHGVPSSTKLPATVASLGPIPAQVTIPIACGAIEPVK